MSLVKFSSKFNYITEAKDKTITFTFGRFQPPTIGHEKLFDKVKSVSDGEFRIYSSHSEDKKNPLDYKTKMNFLKKIFPKYKKNVTVDKARTALEIAAKLYDEGFTKLQFVVGSDRVKSFDSLLTKYNGDKSKHGYYNFQEIKVISAGERDPDADGVSGMSASKMRKLAIDGEFDKFKKGLPSNFKDSQKLYDILRTKLGVKEMINFTDWLKLF
jgi:hypothetical protein|tara:strand:+ start:1197 stop:1838 length:642 start_codon:yes stop_codon:yes gene_type:complete